MGGIRNLNDLQLKKFDLQRQIDKGFENPLQQLKDMFVSSNNENESLVGELTDSLTENQKLLDEGVKAVLTLVASTAVTRFNLGTVPKLLLTTGVAIVTPIVVDKIQKALHKNTKY